MALYICGPNDAPKHDVAVINTTSRSSNWSRGLSPFFLGPVDLYGDYTAKNVENAWQYSKVYKYHTDSNGDPKPEYFEWAEDGWNNDKAVRYPMGRGAVPEYSYWDGNKYKYIDARKKIYAPIYSEAVRNTVAFKQLKDFCDIYAADEDVYLWDFDGYNHKAISKPYSDVIDDPNRKMGHAFVLGMMLENEVTW